MPSVFVMRGARVENSVTLFILSPLINIAKEFVKSVEPTLNVAPVPRPEGDFKWSGIKNNWVALPPYPTDGKLYTFDITTEAWIPNE